MPTDLLREGAQFGVFAVLFVWLLFYVLRENSRRESNYQDVIKTLSKTIQSELCEIKEQLKKRGLKI